MTTAIRLRASRYHSPDVALFAWEPTSLEEVFFLLEFEIGLDGDERRDLFEVVVATPEGLRAIAGKNVIADRATLVISEYSWARVRQAVEEIIKRCQAPSWREAVMKLQRYFRWEYEDWR